MRIKISVKITLLVLLLIPVCFSGFSETPSSYESELGLAVFPGVDIPFGETNIYLSSGFIAGLNLRYSPEVLPPFVFSGSFEFVRNARDEEQFLTKLALSAGGGISLPILSWLSLSGIAEAGYSWCMMEHEGEVEQYPLPVVTLAAGPSFHVLPELSLDIDVSWQYFSGFNSIALTAGLTYYFENKPDFSGPPVLEGMPPELLNLEFETIFPIFYKYYDEHPIGSGVLINPREDEVSEVGLKIFIRQYMDAPKRCSVPESLQPGEMVEINLDALFNSAILEITEGTKAAAEITLDYSVNGNKYSDTITETVTMHYRNAMTWDDDRRAAAFVTAKDPLVMGFAKNVVSMLQDQKNTAVSENLQKAIVIHDAVTLYGMSYIIDPNTSYAEYSRNATAVDYLQFPRETLQYKAGDCDDLAILYCALLEAVGVETAFVTVPGHIYIAFSLGMSEREAGRAYYDPDNLIFIDGDTWVPLEITALENTFLQAWALGAKQWRENRSRNLTGFFPVHEAWRHYEPVGLTGGRFTLEMPSGQDVVEMFWSELSMFIYSIITPQETRLNEKIEQSGGQPQYINNLGVLYARFGLFEKSKPQFDRVLASREFIPTLINLGNIHYIEGEMEIALEYYERAYAAAPENVTVLLGNARVNHSLGNFELSKIQYDELRAKDPELAAKFSYLDSSIGSDEKSARIGDAEGMVIWEKYE